MDQKEKVLTNDQKTYISALFGANVKKIDIVRMSGLEQSTLYSFLQRYFSEGVKKIYHDPGDCMTVV